MLWSYGYINVKKSENYQINTDILRETCLSFLFYVFRTNCWMAQHKHATINEYLAPVTAGK